MQRRIIILTAVLAVASFVGAGQPIDKIVSASPDGIVEISNIAGSVDVTGWNRDEVKVTGTLGDGTEGIDIESHGDRIEIEVKYPDHHRHYGNVQDTRLEVMVPVGSRLEVGTVSADISVDGVAGDVELESVSGRVDLRGNPNEVDIETVSGKITVDSARGSCELASVSGDIVIRSIDGSLDVESVSGTIEVLAGQLDRFDAETVSGSIRVMALPTPNANFQIEAHSGTVVIAVPASLGADFDISTFSGSIDNELGSAAVRTSQYAPGKRLSFTNAGGGARIRVDSFSGSVTLKKN